jgi:hypothetical protein
MKTSSLRGRRGGDGEQPDPVVALLLFEVADCLLALPATEVVRLLGPDAPRSAVDQVEASAAWIDLNEYFTGGRSEGPWLRWRREQQHAWLRVERVVEVLPCPIRALSPMPSPLRAGRGAGAFWAAGVRGDDVFLLMDPARLEDRRAALTT